ncbi:uncharacterized protein C2845_PM06G05090 [Panicum miliaceum]|uniref:Bifunctional inhibitor/plant lipid transfer protein/seed storage helical domain-containing protein n=1 Tax=Panicum miliaceum TaxID=4540 RepID=A0A3L6RDI1_PANMI|nr:uncharacterized protein C2845_PM06G05090 [Panicum miliaceum]
MTSAKALGVFFLLVVLAISPCPAPARAYQLLDLKAKVLHKCMMYIQKTAELMPKRSSPCCDKVRKADVKDICNKFTNDEKVKIKLEKSVQVSSTATLTPAAATAIAAKDRLLVKHLLEAQNPACSTEKYRNKCDLKEHDPGTSA